MSAPTTPPGGVDVSHALDGLTAGERAQLRAAAQAELHQLDEERLDQVLAVGDAAAHAAAVDQWLQRLRGLAEQHQLPPLIVPPVWIRDRFELHPWLPRRDMTTLAAWCEVLDDDTPVEVWRLWQPSGYDPYPGHPDATTGGGVIGVHGQLLGEPVLLLADSFRIPPAPADLDLDVIRELAEAEQTADTPPDPEPEPEPEPALRRPPSPVPLLRPGPATPGQLFVKDGPNSGNVPPPASDEQDVITAAPSDAAAPPATSDTNGGS